MSYLKTDFYCLELDENYMQPGFMEIVDSSCLVENN